MDLHIVREQAAVFIHEQIVIFPFALCCSGDFSVTYSNLMRLRQTPHFSGDLFCIRCHFIHMHGKSAEAHFRKEDTVRPGCCCLGDPCFCCSQIFFRRFQYDFSLCNGDFHMLFPPISDLLRSALSLFRMQRPSERIPDAVPDRDKTRYRCVSSSAAACPDILLRGGSGGWDPPA